MKEKELFISNLKYGKRYREYLNNVYYDLDSPAAYAGMNKILSEARKQDKNIKLKDVDDFLHKQRTYTLFKPIKKKFTRLKTIPKGLNTDWQCDLCIFDMLKQHNDNFKYLLVCIDTLSRMIHVAPSKSKKSEDMMDAFDIIFNKSKLKPHRIYSDAGVEFEAKKMIDYFEKQGISKFTMYSPNIHAGMVERANRTIKERLYKYFSEKNTLRWIDIIDKIVEGINNSINRTTGIKPISVNKDNAKELFEKLYKEEKADKIPKYKLGEIIRITKTKGKFDKGYYPNFTDELFKIGQVNKTKPISYRIKDLEDNIIKGIFYEPELVRTTEDTTHRIAEVIKTRTRKGIKEHLVRWVGYSDKHNSWVKDSDIIK